MTDQVKETWQNYMALTTLVMAVGCTFSSTKQSDYSSQSMDAQILAASQWSYYQAKNVRSNLYQVRKEALILEKENLPNKTAQRVLDNYDKAIAAADERIKRYETEKDEIEVKAKNLEQVRDDASRMTIPFAQAVIFLQISIILSAVATLIIHRQKEVWLCSLPLGVWGLVHLANGYLQFM